MNKEMLLNNKLPIVTEYDDRYENADIMEVLRQAENNDPAAIYELAYRARKGEGGVKKNIHKSMELYKKVLEFQRNICAMYRLGRSYRLGEMGEENKAECVCYFEAATELGDPDSAVQLGLLYEFGDFVDKDYDKAFELYSMAVKGGRKDAYFYMGEIYRYKNRIGEAVQCYNLAMENGNLSAALPLGWFYEQGIGVEKCEEKAFELYQQAYEDGNPDSIFYLGRMHYLGKGTEENDAMAFCLLKEASEQGYKIANCFLGSLYAAGIEGVIEKNSDVALEYLSDVTEDYESDAWYIKGRIYLSENNMDEARKWFSKAAEAGNEEAAEILEKMPEQGKSIEELAEDGSDPYAMIRYTGMVLSDKEKGGISKAVDIITRAVELFPDNLDVKEMYARIMGIEGHILSQIGADEDSAVSLKKCLDTIDILKYHNFNPEAVRKIEVGACMTYGELANRNDMDDLALEMLERTDWKKYPYAAVLAAIIHCRDVDRYSREIEKDIRFLCQAVQEDNWRNENERSKAYYMISITYAYGIATITKNINYAYECIQKCAEIDYSMAEEELKKYSVSFFGKITYKG